MPFLMETVDSDDRCRSQLWVNDSKHDIIGIAEKPQNPYFMRP